MALSNAERQRRYRRRQQALRRQAQRPQSRAQRWYAAVHVLQALQSEYRQWLDNLPEAFCESPVAEKLAAVCDLDLEALEVDLPRGWGRD
jgi:hypothetical protein